MKKSKTNMSAREREEINYFIEKEKDFLASGDRLGTFHNPSHRIKLYQAILQNAFDELSEELISTRKQLERCREESAELEARLCMGEN